MDPRVLKSGVEAESVFRIHLMTLNGHDLDENSGRGEKVRGDDTAADSQGKQQDTLDDLASLPPQVTIAYATAKETAENRHWVL